jgi:hypothetical protein
MTQTAPQTAPPAGSNEGVPLFLPILVGLIAIGFAVFIAIRICPTLSALVAPPDPVLPPGTVLQSRETKGTQDEWLYTSTTPACQVAEFYEKNWNGQCVYDPGSGCSGTTPRLTEQAVTIARCEGRQSISQFNIYWWTTISASNDEKFTTTFRIFRYLP